MRPLQKMAWFSLGVSILAAAGFLLLVPLAGAAAARGALGLVGLIGLGLVFLRRKKGEGFWDERDREVERQSSLAALWVFFMYFVACGMFIMLGPGDRPLERDVFMAFFLFGLLIFFAVQAAAALVLYGTDREKPGGLLEGLRTMTKLQKGSLLVLLGVVPMLTAFFLAFPQAAAGTVEIALAFALFLATVILFFAVPAAMTPDEADRRDEAIGRRARRARLYAAAVSAAAGCLAVAALYAWKGPGQAYAILFLLAGFCAFSAGLLVFLVSIVLQCAGWGKKTTEEQNSFQPVNPERGESP
ncbi:MAG: DUF2178 domain-containing protein [Candidatus Glassbacteria bacterium]|nr:DUF2178 domain-containing protein [Candidatus Glassbacteria bacterium]